VQDGIGRTRLDVEGEDRFQRLRAELGASAFGLNLIRLDPGQRGRIHAHERQEEVYVVLRGTLTLLVEGEAHELGPDEAVRVAPALKRQLVNLGEERAALRRG
jgi:mannose-6-phosphate isomerase-like protein (cupin superfamily)